MASGGSSNGDERVPGDSLSAGPASTAVVSLSQVLLAPLDAIFKAQVHAARSFLNLVLQLAYPHEESEEPEGTAARGPERMYLQDFVYPVKDGGKSFLEHVRLSPLALVPVTPLTVEEATFSLKMAVSHVAHHRQLRVSERSKAKNKRPGWYLVDEPISVRGVIAPSYSEQEGAAQKPAAPAAEIAISVKLARGTVPSGLAKLLVVMTEKATATREQDTEAAED